ncbi:MAG: sugar phosphate isomerase/epimerase family protein [Fimbriimonas sp.]
MKPLSIQLYTVRTVVEKRGLPAVLEEIAEIGYRGVEGGAGNGLTAAEFRTMVEDLGMFVSSTWGDVATVDGAHRLVEACQTLGTNFAAGGFWIPAFETVEAIEDTARKLNETLPILEAAGITFGLHNHWMEFELRNGELAMDHLVRLVPNLKLELDIYWSSNFGANRPEEMVAKYADRVALMHVKDGPQVKDAPMTAVGHGTVDVPACIHAADPAWLIVELDEYAGDMMDAVRDSHAYLTGNGLAQGRS